MARHFFLFVAILLLIGLGIGIFWTVRMDVPKPKPWWYGKKAVFRAEVWEPGKDMATVSMTVPKQTLDLLYGFGLRSKFEMNGHDYSFDHLWHDIQRLPRGHKIRAKDGDATFTVWIQEPGEIMPPDSATTTAANWP